MDGYFGALDAETTSGQDDDRTQLLEGISADLVDGANDALDAIEYLRYSDFFAMQGYDWGKMREDVAGVYREFSDADIDRESTEGLQEMINQIDKIWKTLQEDSKTKLDQAEKRMEYWRGEAANAVKSYINDLSETYARVETKITVLESDVVAAREAIATARQDLSNLGSAFKETAKKFQKDKAQQSDAAGSKVLAAAFAGAVTGLLAVATGGAGAAAGGAVFTAANGALVAGNAAGAALSQVVANSTEVSGDNVMDIYTSFMENADKIRSGMGDTSEDLAQHIGIESRDLPSVPPPPDVSPGDHFDPDNFETGNTSRQTEKRVRDSGVDIAPDGTIGNRGGSVAGSVRE
ncbi:hypothetical protein [Amycolatopsis samaneae]|uniref:WXG100 family type VII secretion target n=1 Tax=Amycolatopsis samaneae TaxID=664691 RepID=A0ABW5GHE4_9PSEU